MDFSVEILAEDALLLRFGHAIDAATNARVHAAARALRDAGLPGVTDIAPAYASLLLRFDPVMWSTTDAACTLPDRLLELLDTGAVSATAGALDPGLRRDDGQGRTRAVGGQAIIVEIPVCYGGAFGPDLDAVAAHAHLTPQEAVARHVASEYMVAMLGFAPGFPYLLGLDPALHAPRRTTPRTRVPAGSVAIGGAQTGIYPRELPGGWNLIGRTPRRLFDPQHAPPALLAAGDHVRFRAIDRDEFDALAEYPT